MIKNLTEGSPRKVLLSFTIPIFFSTIFQQFYTIADSIIAGKFAGEDALAAIGASYPLTMVFMAVSLGSNTGCSVIISQLFGAGRIKDMKTAVSTAMLSLAVLSAVLTAIALVFSPWIMTALNTPDNILADANTYFKIYIGGFIFLSLYNIANGAFTALGDSKTPLWFLIGSSVANIVLDYVFVAVFPWGVAGAAWATFISQGAACILSVICLINRLRSMQSERHKYFSFSSLRSIAKVSSQTILQQSFVSVGNMLVQGIINDYGSAVIAGYAAATKLNTFSIAGICTVSNAMSAFTAQNIGARNYERIKKGYRASVGIIMCIALTLTAAYTLFGDFFVNLFLKSDSSVETLESGTVFLMVVAPFYPVVSIKLLSDAVTRGAGALKLFAISTFADLIIRVGLSYALSPSLGIMGVAYSWPIGWAIGAVIAYLFYRFGNWRNYNLT